MKFQLFTQVTLKQDLPQYNLKKGDVGMIVEYYPMPDGQEDGYSLEGFDVPGITIELEESQIEALVKPNQIKFLAK